VRTTLSAIWLLCLAISALAQPLWPSFDTNRIDTVARALIVQRFPEVATNDLRLRSMTRELTLSPESPPEIIRILYQISGTEGTNTSGGQTTTTYEGITIVLDQKGAIVDRGGSGCYKTTLSQGALVFPIRFGITFTDQPLQVVLDYYSKLAGQKVVTEADPHTIVPTFTLHNVTQAEGVLELERVLLKNGYDVEKHQNQPVRVIRKASQPSRK